MAGETIDRIADRGLELFVASLVHPPELPVVLAAIFGSSVPGIRVGSAAGADLADATARAIFEAALSWELARRFGEPAPLQLRAPADARVHAAHYAVPERARELWHRLHAGASEAAGPLTTPCATTGVDALLALAPDAVEVDITPHDCEACGFQAVRIVAAGLPLFQFGAIGTPRRHASAYALPLAVAPHPYS
jgi:ribosomal protein S12 methylthiotransferase accessory factor YcaO